MPLLAGGAYASRERPIERSGPALPLHAGRDAQGLTTAGAADSTARAARQNS